MTATEIQLANLAAKQTSSIAVLVMAGTLLVVPVEQGISSDVVSEGININASSAATSSYHNAVITDTAEVSNGHIAGAFLDVHEKLIAEQSALDPVAEKALCDNLWDLYI